MKIREYLYCIIISCTVEEMSMDLGTCQTLLKIPIYSLAIFYVLTLFTFFYLCELQLSQLSNGDNFKSCFEGIPDILVAEIKKKSQALSQRIKFRGQQFK